jgi:hypothetical protein
MAPALPNSAQLSSGRGPTDATANRLVATQDAGDDDILGLGVIRVLHGVNELLSDGA